MVRFSSVVAFAIVVSGAYASTEGDAIIKQIESVKRPTWDKSKENDKAWMDKYMKGVAASTKQKNDLILRLYKTDPSNPKTVTYMRERWRFFEGGNVGDGNAYNARILADIDAVLKSNPPSAIAEAGEAAKIETQIEGHWDWSGALPAIEAFVKKYPKSEEGPTLMIQATYSMNEEKRLPVYKRFLELYPNEKFTPMVKGSVRRAEAIGKPFELKFTDALTGKPWDIADQKGKVVVLDFWATWCGPCVAKMPEVKKVLDTYKSQGLVVVGISLDQPEKDGGLKALKDFIAKNGYPWAQYYQGKGWDSEFSTGWGIMSIPNVFIVDKQGNLREVGVRNLEESVKKLLAEKS